MVFGLRQLAQLDSFLGVIMTEICFFIGSLGYGGAERSLINLINVLPESIKADIIVWNDDLSLFNYLSDVRKSSTKIFKLEEYVNAKIIKNNKLKNLFKLYAVKRIVNNGNYSAFINYHLISNYRISCFKYKIPSIAWYHGCAELNAKNDYGFLLQNKKLVNSCDKIVFVSDETLKNGIDNYGCKNGVSINNIIPYKEILLKSSEEDFEIDNSYFNIVTVGRLGIEKGFDLAISAAEKLNKKGYRFKWYFVGDGPMKNELQESVINSGLSDSIVFTGFKNNPFPIIKKCDLYVSCSYNEAYPLSICEAKVLGVPVVSTATVGGKSLIKDNETGFISDINAESLFKCIERAINNQEGLIEIKHNLTKVDYDKFNSEIVDGLLKLIISLGG